MARTVKIEAYVTVPGDDLPHMDPTLRNLKDALWHTMRMRAEPIRLTVSVEREKVEHEWVVMSQTVSSHGGFSYEEVPPERKAFAEMVEEAGLKRTEGDA